MSADLLTGHAMRIRNIAAQLERRAGGKASAYMIDGLAEIIRRAEAIIEIDQERSA